MHSETMARLGAGRRRRRAGGGQPADDHYAATLLTRGVEVFEHTAFLRRVNSNTVGSLRSAICLLAADVLTMGGQGGGPRRAVRRLTDT